jgi:hypothetical protein
MDSQGPVEWWVGSYIQSNERNLELFNFCEFTKKNLGILVNFHEQIEIL